MALALLCAVGAVEAQIGRYQPPDPAAFGNVVESGDLRQARAWLDEGLDPDFLADRIGTGLMIAAWRGDLKMMELFVARGADVNRANKLGERALMHAAWRGNLDAVRWLLARGARVDSEPMRWSPLHYAVFAGHAEVAKLLLERGADINARSTNGSSVLMMAVYEGHEQLVRDLLARGADTSVKNDRGEGALEWSFKFKRLAIARMVSAPQQFAAAASKPKSAWAEPIRSEPSRTAPQAAAPPPNPHSEIDLQIEDLVNMREVLAARGIKKAVATFDRRIAALRAKRAREDRSTPAAVLEITASRASPQDQRTRLLFEAGGPPP